MQNLLTIVIPTYNEEYYIVDTLFAIIKQVGSKGVKIIIADAGSTDRTVECCNEIKNAFDLNLEIIKGGLPSVGRNNGAKLATTPYVLFLDADVKFTSGTAIRKALTHLVFLGYHMVSTTPVYKGEPDWRATLMFIINKYVTMAMSKIRPFAIGGFTMVYKPFFDGIGGYNEEVKQAEDWLLSSQVAPSKFKLITGLMTQDNRRFKKYGYLNMIKLIRRNWLNRNNLDYFKEDQGYWD
jgi:glycosyltransferase involved in cell wall biosynthesis